MDHSSSLPSLGSNFNYDSFLVETGSLRGDVTRSNSPDELFILRERLNHISAIATENLIRSGASTPDTRLRSIERTKNEIENNITRRTQRLAAQAERDRNATQQTTTPASSEPAPFRMLSLSEIESRFVYSEATKKAILINGLELVAADRFGRRAPSREELENALTPALLNILKNFEMSEDGIYHAEIEEMLARLIHNHP